MTAGQYDQGNSSVEILSSWLTLGQKLTMTHGDHSEQQGEEIFLNVSHADREKY